ncbi:hypothetical protein CKO35_12370 [Ectothiorhodospira shaposhnikovii]|uniref:low molecular weight protein-tyrosine-phosphatase n=1 Tax=Ectothiorhodospira shaposhnikovii TaxID=1054 RepID=UPI00190813E5|nr:low molecular weight protein-tyrosine-phosphatase [Ectothiorhodospira shaposhnikovii]MBK1674084.1 hypothetical protein [Ectothiorhodospira shaposhnikovii]
MFRHLLTICTGNICRSPLAQACLEAMASDSGRELVVQSAGTSALAGHPAEEITRRLAALRGLSLDDHKGQQVSIEHLRWADLVLVMEPHHQQYLLDLYPTARGKIFLLGHWTEQVIDDPFQQAEHVHLRIHQQIHEATKTWIDKMMKS